MKRLQLTDEEVRHIEQRRLMENRFNLGYNQAVIDMIALRQETGDDMNAFFKQANEARKPIRP
jgi:hypothetical protein